jgi:hypothetical protein
MANEAYGETVVIQLTLQCPLACAHCITESSPLRHEDMASSTLERLIAGLAEDGRVRHLVFSGGEPFAKRARLRAAVAQGRAIGLAMSIVTSGSWAVSDESARSVMTALGGPGAGGGEVIVSVDRHRLAEISFENWRRALEASEALGWRIGLFITCDNTRDDIESIARTALGDDLFERARRRRIVTEFAGRVTKNARLTQMLDWCTLEEAVDEPCPGAAAPLVRPDLVVATCCGIPSEVTAPPEPLSIGRADLEPPGAWLDRGSRDPLIAGIHALGPKRLLLEAIKRSDHPPPTGPWLRGSICQTCRVLTSDRALSRYAAEFALSDDGQRAITVARAFHQALAAGVRRGAREASTVAS